MSHLGDNTSFSPEMFSGQARLFPLPNLVLFPHVIQPLHIFEPRYVDLLHESLQDDRLIAMALLDGGWEQDYEGRPPLMPVACLGRVISCQAQGDNRYNLLLMGLRRVRIVRELEPHKSFREAQVEVLEDEYPPIAGQARPALQRKLIAAFEYMLPRIADAQEMFNQLSLDSVSLGTLTDVISYALDLDLPAKQHLLAQPNVDQRAKLLLKHLKTAQRAAPANACFPPAFSCN
jgi:Lon protease-like protein